MPDDFQVGEEVEPKSGGGRMVITAIEGDKAYTEFRDKNGEKREEVWHLTSLRRPKPPIKFSDRR